ncbi:MAG: hypothetical protein JO236_02300 [Mycobacterium sp.]|uniref:hypothetical protein n=1 Tax=Mycobacterium sp. TaxID=1785 RepID=UPI001EB34B88|nr:hypothetical protein [Mycobacterium sp.]MBW0016370.1 hypothetical protein [Mycobacterium sp.]
MRAQGHQIFADELAQFAAGGTDARVSEIAERVATPLRVTVRGRPGAGRGTVARALAAAGRPAGLSVAPAGGADVVVYVITEVVKLEDADEIAVLASSLAPVLVVLNKADLCGFAGDGPITAAQARCRQFAAHLGAAVEPMIGLLAVTALDDQLDDDLWAALHALASCPGGSVSLDGSFDGFLGANNPVPTDARLRLLDALDLFGTALAVAAVRQRNGPAQLRALLRRVSCVDGVVDRIVALGAETRYQRVLDAVAELEALAVSGDQAGERVSEFLSRDDTVIARMGAAVDLAEALGLPVGVRDDPAGHLPRAVRWQQFSLGKLGSVSDMHRACGADIARGSLRLWSRAGGTL